MSEEIRIPGEENTQPAPEKKQEKVISNDYQKAKLTQSSDEFSSVTVIAIGQGGSKLGHELADKLAYPGTSPRIIAINTAKADLDSLNIPDDMKVLIGDGSGGGKVRDYAKEQFWNSEETQGLFEDLVTKHSSILFGNNQIILVVFSSGGATGSGIGPKFVAKLTQYCNNYTGTYNVVKDNGTIIQEPAIKFKPNVIGVCLTPDLHDSLDTGLNTIENTLSCLSEINTLIEHNAATFCIVKNKVDEDIASLSTDSLFNKTNQAVIDGFRKYIRLVGSSENNTNLDVRDRFNALKMPGLMAFADLNLESRYRMLLPVQGSNVINITAELTSGFVENDSKENLMKMKDFLANYIVSDSTIGWNDVAGKTNEELIDHNIILLSGFKNLNKLADPIRALLDRKRNEARNNSVDAGKSFNNLDQVKSSNAQDRLKDTNLDIDSLI